MVFSTYTREPGLGKDYEDVRAFLLKRADPGYTFGRWDWMVTHPNLMPEALPRIGLWKEGEELVAVALFDCRPGRAYLLELPGYADIRAEMLEYAQRELRGEDGGFRLMVREGDVALETIAANAGYIATPDREPEAVFDIGATSMEYALPEGFRITDMEETFDLGKYGEALWYGFGHGEDGPFEPTEEDSKIGTSSMLRINVDLRLKVAVLAPNGRFAAYCGMWYDPRSEFAVVEPVVTQPQFRKRGLGRAAVLEGIRRCGELGAKRAYVGSSQQFYYSIGFRPSGAFTEWKRAK